MSAAVIAAACGAAPAEAAWVKAESPHFVIYADKAPETLQAFAGRLERFDSAVRTARGMEEAPPGPHNRVTIYVLPDTAALQALIRAPGSGIAGLYVPRFSGSVAFVPDRTDAIDPDSFTPESVFFHEYAHHLMLQSLGQVVPEWLVEGFAEFYSTARIEPDGSVGFGIAPAHRGFGINYLEGLPLRKMLAGNFVRGGNAEELIYGQGWLLTHYLAFDKQRTGQVGAYIDAITDGETPLAAAEKAFGDIAQLDRELSAYRKRRKLDYVLVTADRIRPAPITVTPLGAGEAAAMPLRMQTEFGVRASGAEALAAKAKAIAEAHPDESAVWVELAEAQLDAGDVEAGLAAAEKALALSPKSADALLLKGVAQADLGEEEPKAADWPKIRESFLTANRIDPDDPEPLVRFYQSFAQQGVEPTRNAVDGLYFAATLAPQDDELRLLVARQLLRDARPNAARRALAGIASNPHADGLNRQAAKAVDLIASGDKAKAIEALNRLIGDSGA